MIIYSPLETCVYVCIPFEKKHSFTTGKQCTIALELFSYINTDLKLPVKPAFYIARKK